MNDIEIAEELGRFPTGNLCNAHQKVRAMHSQVSPLFQGAKISGPAKTVKIKPGQNAAIHRAVHTAKRGDVLVVESAGNRDFGPFGDILTTCCQNKGISGLVIDGTVRDTEEIRQLLFPVFCLGANPTATGKSDPGETDIDIECAGVQVCPGDFVVGDDDGVVVIPRSITQEVIAGASQVVRKEEAIMERLENGETTLEIFKIEV